MRHALAVHVTEACEAEERFDHVCEALAGRDLHAHPDVPVARVPPVVPHARLGGARLALPQDARLPVPFHRQLALEHGEALDHRSMAVLANNARTNERGQLVDRAALGVLPRKLENREALTVNGILPNLANLNGGEVWRAVRVGVRHAKRSSSAPIRLSRKPWRSPLVGHCPPSGRGTAA